MDSTTPTSGATNDSRTRAEQAITTLRQERDATLKALVGLSEAGRMTVMNSCRSVAQYDRLISISDLETPRTAVRVLTMMMNTE